ncbi:MAG: hypothetical protein ACLGIV_06630 [Actinomycetes bacterium]
MTSSRGTVTAVMALVGSVLLACTEPGSRPEPPGPTEEQAPEAAEVVTSAPADPAVVLLSTDPASAALATSRELFDTAPVVVVGSGDDATAMERAVALRVPFLVADGDPGDLVAELDRLDAEAVLAPADADLAAMDDAGVDVVRDVADLPPTEPAGALDDVLVLTDGQPWAAAAVAVAQSAGARTRTVPSGDPRADAELVTTLTERPASHVVALGDVFRSAEVLAARMATASSGAQLPGGGQVLFPHRRMVALYGHPDTPSLGVLGEQDLTATVARAREVAAEYEAHTDVPVVPAFEIIATVASADAGPDGDYSAEASVDELRPWVDAAADAGVYVLLDLQPGTTDFLTQAQRYADLLREPHVGLALDPEWRLRPGQRHLEQIGSVDVEEVNAVAEWLAGLTREGALPQKMLVVHQFRLSMVRGRERLATGFDELAVVLHADGNGPRADKLATWDALRADAPPGVHWAWKNFYDEDSPVFSPEETSALSPTPVLVTYQ